MINDPNRSTLTRRDMFAVLYNLFSFARCAVAVASLFLISTSDVGHNPFNQSVANVLKVVHHDRAASIFPTPFSMSRWLPCPCSLQYIYYSHAIASHSACKVSKCFVGIL